MYFQGPTDDLQGAMAVFIRRLSNLLEDLDLSLLDRAEAKVAREGEDALAVTLPHRQQRGYDMNLLVRESGCTAFYGRAHSHFEGENWVDGTLNFLYAQLLGHVAVWALCFGEATAAFRVYGENEQGEWLLRDLAFYRPNPLRRWRIEERRVCFAAPEDFERMNLKRARELAQQGDCEPVQGSAYFRRAPREMSANMRRFFDEFCRRLEALKPPLLDERFTAAYLVREEDGDFLCIKLSHKEEPGFYVGADVYDDHCDLFYGNGEMSLRDADWFQESFGFLGALLLGKVEAASHYRGGRLCKVVWRFCLDDKTLRWVQRRRRKWLGRRRVEVQRVSFTKESAPPCL